MNDIQAAAMMELPNMRPLDTIDSDGMIVCGICGKRRTRHVVIPQLKIDRVAACMCDCDMSEATAKSDGAAKRDENVTNAAIMRCFPSMEYRHMTFERDNGSQARVSASLRRYVSKFEEMRNRGLGFVLQGDKGNGKTFLAACVANALLSRYRVKFTSIAALAPGMAMYSGRDDAISELKTRHLVIIDDFGTERTSETMLEAAYVVVNTLYECRIPTIYTTNNDLTKIESQAYGRIADRIIERCPVIKMGGESIRKAVAQENLAIMRDIMAEP